MNTKVGTNTNIMMTKVIYNTTVNTTILHILRLSGKYFKRLYLVSGKFIRLKSYVYATNCYHFILSINLYYFIDLKSCHSFFLYLIYISFYSM